MARQAQAGTGSSRTVPLAGLLAMAVSLPAVAQQGGPPDDATMRMMDEDATEEEVARGTERPERAQQRAQTPGDPPEDGAMRGPQAGDGSRGQGRGPGGRAGQAPCEDGPGCSEAVRQEARGMARERAGEARGTAREGARQNRAERGRRSSGEERPGRAGEASRRGPGGGGRGQGRGGGGGSGP